MKGDRAVFDCRQAKNKMGHSFAVHEVTNFTNLFLSIGLVVFAHCGVFIICELSA